MNSRYYDPNWGRFINSDTVIAGIRNDLLSNMYAYTENNPIIRVDYEGTFGTIAILGAIGEIAVGTISAVSKMVKHHQTKGKIKVSDWLQYTSEGAQVTSGIMNFDMMGQNVYNTASFNYNSYQISKYPAPVHGNSLKTTKPA